MRSALRTHDWRMEPGIPGTPDGPPILRGELIVRFMSGDGLQVEVPVIDGESQQDLLRRAAQHLTLLADAGWGEAD